MFRFIFKFLKGLIVGWIVSLMMYLVKRMLAKAFGAGPINSQPHQNPKNWNPNRTSSANQNRQDIVETMWVGMSASQLVNSLGPALTKDYSGNREIWTYLNLKGQGTKTAVAIENGIVVNWQDMPVNAYMPQRAPAP